MQETTIVGMIPMQETTNIVANVKDCPISELLFGFPECFTMSGYCTMLCNS